VTGVYRREQEITMTFGIGRVAALLALVAPLLAFSTAAPAQELNPKQKLQMQNIVRDYILENPEIIQEAMARLEQKRKDAEVAARKRTITDQAKLLFNSPRQVVLGNPDGDVTLVEFFDYNCGFCKRAMGDLVKLLDTDKNLRVVMKEFPVLGKASFDAAKVSIAVSLQSPEKYAEFHMKLLRAPGQAGSTKALAVAKSVGIDMDQLRKDMRSPEINATVEEVYALAEGLGLTGTPSYVVGTNVVFGAVGYAELKRKINEARNCIKTGTC
jgi:protein-disulfide isomerase